MASAVHGISSVWASSVGDVLGGFFRRARMGPLFRWRFTGFRPGQILASPPDLHLADPSLAHEFYHGRFPLAGRVVQAGSVSPFMVEPPSADWEAALHDFSWLRHMAAAGTELADAHARALLADWVETTGKRISGMAWRSDITARRIIAWLCHADTLLYNAPPSFDKLFLKALGIQVRYLRTAINSQPENEARLQAAIALALAALTLPVSASIARNARRSLEREISRQILPDGGHISRNPAILLDILAYLIPLQHCYSESNETPPPVLIAAIDRMLPALRFFQHRDGTLANFNGVGPTLAARLNKVLAVDETAGIPFANAPHSGYQRLAAGQTTLIADTGKAPPRALSQQANAGCLSFEMSSGQHRFIVNCGIDPFGPGEFRFFGRLTAAHSTATLNDTSSCQFRRTDKPDSTLASSPSQVRVRQIEEVESQGFIATHNGYMRNFHLIHQRTIMLSQNGNILEGSDSFLTEDAYPPATQHEATVRFHLHPDVEISHLDHQGTTMLRLERAEGDTWLFSSDAAMHMEDSIYFSGLGGPAKTRQIVLTFCPSEQASVKWVFQRLGTPGDAAA